MKSPAAVGSPPAAMTRSLMNQAPTMAERPTKLPTERSIPAVMITIVIPIATMAITTTRWVTFLKLSRVKKVDFLRGCGVRTANFWNSGYFSGTASMTSIPAGPAVAIAPRGRPSSRSSLSLTLRLRGAPMARRTLSRPSVLSRWARDLAKVSKSVLSFP